MFNIKTVAPDSHLLADVKCLWGSNRQTLGFLPDGAFTERAQKGQILAAVEGESLLGYLLFFTKKTSHNVELTHLCVADSGRSKGVARALVEHLRSTTRSYYGILLSCRRDFPAFGLWPKLGFVAVNEFDGRAGRLTRFMLRHPHPSLLDRHEASDQRLLAAMDSNIVFDLEYPSREWADEARGLKEDWLAPHLSLRVTEEVLNDINLCGDVASRAASLAAAKSYEVLESDPDLFLKTKIEVEQMLGTPKTERDAADQRHVARAIASEAAALITRDSSLLGHADEIYAQYGMRVVRPSTLIGNLEELLNEQQYQRERLAGSPITVARIPHGRAGLVETFSGYPGAWTHQDLTRHLNLCWAAPTRCEVRVVSDQGESPLAIYTVERVDSGTADITMFAVRAKLPLPRLRNTLIRTLLMRITLNALSTRCDTIRISDDIGTVGMGECLVEAGFVRTTSEWSKWALRERITPAGAAAKLIEKLSLAQRQCPELSELAVRMAGQLTVEQAAEAEHLLWPLKLTGSGVPNFIVPIKPVWAKHLLDAGLSDRSLFPSDTDLALNPEAVYYRGSRPKILRAPGRILWYVSDDGTDGTKRIRACSRLTHVEIGPAKDVFRQYERFGIFRWPNVLETAHGDPQDDVMALRISDVERFSRGIGWDVFQAILRRHGVRTNLQSPVEIPEAVFIDIYERGLGKASGSEGSPDAAGFDQAEIRSIDSEGAQNSRAAPPAPESRAG